MKYVFAAVIALGTFVGVSAYAAPVSQDAASVEKIAASDVTKVDWYGHERWRSHHRWGSWGGGEGWHNRWRSHHRWGSWGGGEGWHNRWRSHHRWGSYHY